MSKHFTSRITSFLAESPRLGITLASLLLILGGLVYLPGASGPYVFDDASNLLTNHYVQITELSWNSLQHAAFTMEAGPLHRPIAMLSFALNYYFAGSFNDTTPYKLTNIVIHIGNGLLIFWIVRLIFTRLAETASNADPFYKIKNKNYTLILAICIAFIWLVHPIQITSVLYLVQRMAALSAMFTLLGLLCYLKGRVWTISGRPNGVWLIVLGLVGCGTLGMLSKENAVLLPLFMLALEFTLFQNEFPWSHWNKLSRKAKSILVFIAVAALTAALAGLLHFIKPSYAIRSFTMIERLLNESRVLFFYLGLILIPRTDQFALHHDDFPLSTSLFAPWTTFPAMLGIAILFITSLVCRRKYPLLSLGILWFFVGHALESTFLGLELVHEHRNYLASMGVWMAVVHLIFHMRHAFAIKKLWMVLPLFAAIFSGITTLRSIQWSNFYALAYYEAAHHPNSADANNFLGVALAMNHQYDNALVSFKRAAEINPNEAVYFINMTVVAARTGVPLSPKEQADTIQSLIANPGSGSTHGALLNISSCLQDECSSLQPTIINWANQLVEMAPGKGDKSFYYYMMGLALSGQGRFDEAITALKRAYQEDKKYLHPLIQIAKVHIKRRDMQNAEEVMTELRAANRENLHPRDSEIAQLAEEINRLKKGEKISP